LTPKTNVYPNNERLFNEELEDAVDVEQAVPAA
jgi:hypothetical protein